MLPLQLPDQPNIVIAPDSFKGSLSAQEAASAISTGVQRGCPPAIITLCPLSDGGEGLSDILVHQLQATVQYVDTVGPLGDTVRAGYGMVNSPQRLLIMDVAGVIGLPLVPDHLRNPYHTLTQGLAVFMEIARQADVEQMIIGLGGSSTVDGGIGLAIGLGYQFEDHKGAVFQPTAATLSDIRHIIAPDNRPWEQLTVCAATDVKNLLLGDTGAARVFGPQKGATSEQVEKLEAGLFNLAACWRQDLGIDVLSLIGGGAAGGLGAGLAAFCGAELVSGIELVMQLLDFEKLAQGADLIVTGEGQFDSQSLNGKVIDGVTQMAARHNTPVIVIAGDSRLSETQWPNSVCKTATIMSKAQSLQDAVQNGARYLVDVTAETMAEIIGSGR